MFGGLDGALRLRLRLRPLGFVGLVLTQFDQDVRVLHRPFELEVRAQHGLVLVGFVDNGARLVLLVPESWRGRDRFKLRQAACSVCDVKDNLAFP